MSKNFLLTVMLLMAAVSSYANNIYRVTAYSLEEEGDGLSWQSPMSLVNALSVAQADDIIYLKAGTYIIDNSITISKAITLKGGFLGTDDETMAEKPLTIFDTDRKTTFDNVLNVTTTSSGAINKIINSGLKNGYARGLYKKGAADLLVEGCLIMTNGLANAATGKGAYVASATGATITFRNTEFRANRQESNTVGSPQPALSLTGCKEAIVDGCSFFGNSLLIVAPKTGETSAHVLGNKFTNGSAIYTTVKTTVVGCRFSGNCANIRSNANTSGTIWFANGSSGSVVSNSLFYGNYDRSAWNYNGKSSGAIVQSMGALTHTLEVVGSTFAYNLSDVTASAAGICVLKGTLNLRDCVFGGNMVNPKSTYKSNDLVVNDDSVANVSYTVFGQDEANTYYKTVYGNINFGEGVVFADPQFVTRPDYLKDILTIDSNTGRRIFKNGPSTYDVLEGIDAHLLSMVGYRTVKDSSFVASSVHSPAIDASSPASQVGDEPSPNASRRNAGFYGGTAEASISSIAPVTIAEEDVTAQFDESTYVTLSVLVRGETPCNATVKIETFSTDPTLDAQAIPAETKSFYSVQKEDVVTFKGTKLNSGEKLYVRVTATVLGIETPVVVLKAFDVGGTLPPYFGHGGGENVVHVRGGAMEKCNGENWTDAFPTLEEALEVVASDATKTEIWIAGHSVSTTIVTKACSPAAQKLFIRGGFSGNEDSLDERASTGVSYVDGQGAFNACFLGNTTGYDVEIERVAFYRMAMNGISKVGGGNLTVRDCHFLTNSTACTIASDKTWSGKGVAGRAIRVTNATGANILVTNCVFRGNRQVSTSGTGGPGAALCFSGCASATVVDCLMHRNGSEMLENGEGSKNPSANGNSSSKGSAIYTAVPTAIVRCEISASGNNIRDNWTGGGAIWFDAGSHGSVISNCLIKANQDRGCWNINGKIGGAIVLSLGNKSDAVTITGSTIAYNFADGKSASGGMTVIKGTANITNCVFAGNFISPTTTEAANDIRIRADGIVNAAYTLIGSERNLSIGNAGVFNEGEGVIFQDPLFVTTPQYVKSLVKFNSTYTYFLLSNVNKLEQIDCHLLSSAGYATNGIGSNVWCKSDGVNSPAIDAGIGDYSFEPVFNGNRRNAGYYGNTIEASKTMESLEPLTLTDISLTYPDTYSRGQVNFLVTGDEGCLVSVRAVITVGEREYVYEVPGCVAGAISTILLPEYVERGTSVEVSLSGTSSSGTVQGGSFVSFIEADFPPWYGCGGGKGVLHLWSKAPGRADGTDWHNAFTSWEDLVAAYNATEGISEIWIIDALPFTREPSTLTVKTNLFIRGGFDNVCSDIESRVEGKLSTLDANKISGILSVKNATHPVVVERMVFTRSKTQGVVKSGAGDIAFTNCTFVSNARGYSKELNGGGLNIVGSAGMTKVYLSDCRILDNGSTGAYPAGTGCGAYFQNCLRVTLDNTLFASNGIAIRSPASDSGSDKLIGSALFTTAAPLTVRNCRFVSNHGTTRDNSRENGSAVRIDGASGGTAFTNCVFACNSDVLGWGASGTQGSFGSALLVRCSSVDQHVDLYNCTIAYNLAGGTKVPGGLFVSRGTVTARNSIFYGNFRTQASADKGIPADVYVADGSSFSAMYSLFTDNTASSVAASEGSTLDIDWTTCIQGDPLFVTTSQQVAAKKAANNLNFLNDQHFFANIDVHLVSSGGYFLNSGEKVVGSEEISQCLDKGDPMSDYSNEPEFNGGRINLGAYGNTPFASSSVFGQPKIDSLEVEYKDGLTRPWITVGVGLEDGAPCNATVTILCTTGGVIVVSETFAGVKTGTKVQFAPSIYLESGDDFEISVEVASPGATVVSQQQSGIVEGNKPIWAGKGGSERIIHVRKGADGLGNGRNWTDAFADLESAIKMIGPSYDAIWIAGDFTVTNALSQPTLSHAFEILGGFDGHENSKEECRQSAASSTLDFGGKANGLVINSSASFLVERIRFMRATTRGLYKGGIGGVVLSGCAFVNNTGSNNVNGRGACLSCNGDVNSGTVGLVTNCLFEGNLQTGGTIAEGQGLYAVNFKSLEIVDCLFITNGPALAVNTAPLTMRRTVFRANRGTSSNSGIVRILNCRGSRLSRCLWIGNDELNSGALVTSLGHQENDITLQHCTIALNQSASKSFSAGITHLNGIMRLENSIVAGNFSGDGCAVGSDLYVDATSSASLAYTLLSSNNTTSVSSAAAGAIDLGLGVIYGDPSLGTSTKEALSLISGSGTSKRYKASEIERVAAFDAHPTSRGGRYDEITGKWVRCNPFVSIAVDAGDPASDWSKEPECAGVGTSGKRVNLGVYGGTRYATMTPHNGSLIIIR